MTFGELIDWMETSCILFGSDNWKSLTISQGFFLLLVFLVVVISVYSIIEIEFLAIIIAIPIFIGITTFVANEQKKEWYQCSRCLNDGWVDQADIERISKIDTTAMTWKPGECKDESCPF